MLWMSSGRKAMEAPGCTVNSRARRSEEHTSELQSQSNLVCRLLISEEHTSELQSQSNLVCRLLLEKKKCTSSTSEPYCRSSRCCYVASWVTLNQSGTQ